MAFNLRRLKAERVASGYTQGQFADKINMSRSAYVKREDGFTKISVEDLSKILKGLGYGPEKVSIFFEDGVRKREQNKEKEGVR